MVAQDWPGSEDQSPDTSEKGRLFGTHKCEESACKSPRGVYTVYMKGEFVFSQTDSRPMYQQIMEQFVQRIAVGDWPPHTPLPSIRELAAETGVSVITVKRAYLELERAGVIVTQQGKGSRVSERLDVRSLQRRELAEHL